MRVFFNYISSGISFLLLYVFTVFLAPILLILLGYSDFTSKPKILTYPIYLIDIEDGHFITEATWLGLLLSFLLGLLLYLIFNVAFKKDREDVENI